MKSLHLLCCAFTFAVTISSTEGFSFPNLFEKFTKLKKCWFESEEEGYPAFCNDLKCPIYTVKSKGKDYEERCYEKTTWAVTSMKMSKTSLNKKTWTVTSLVSPMLDENTLWFNGMYAKLFNYIHGKNEGEREIKMTVPVLIGVRFEENDTADVRMHFFVPPSKVDDMPKPKNKDISFLTYDTQCWYVKVYSGWQNGFDSEFMHRRKTLMKSLDKAGLEYNDKLHIYAGYDSPWKSSNRHNEVILLKKKPKKGQFYF